MYANDTCILFSLRVMIELWRQFTRNAL